MIYGSRHTVTAINWRMLLKVTGWLLMIESALMLIPALTALYFHESDVWPISLTAAGTALAGLCMRCIRAGHTSMGRREGFLLTASVWVWFSLFGMLPFVFSQARMSVTDGFFEAMSGFTTTGASVFGSHGHLSHGINMWRALTQWMGGMGIILFTLAVIPMLNSSGGMQMFNAEVTGITHDKLRPRISATAKALWGTYFGLTALLALLLWIGPMNMFDSVCYALSTISTGGFSPTDGNLAVYNSNYTYIVLIVFMFIGGVNISLVFQAVMGHPRQLWKNEMFRWYVGVVVAFYASFAISWAVRSRLSASWEEYTILPLFQVVSTMSSTGLNSGRMPHIWSHFLVSLGMIMVFAGACAGSTSGGAKLDRIVVLLKHMGNEISRCVRPNAVYSVRMNGKVVRPELVDKVTAFLCIFVGVTFAGGVILTAIGVPVYDSYVGALSCMTNNTEFSVDYADIPVVGKWVLSALMMIGRLELFTVLLLFTRSFWRR